MIGVWSRGGVDGAGAAGRRGAGPWLYYPTIKSGVTCDPVGNRVLPAMSAPPKKKEKKTPAESPPKG